MRWGFGPTSGIGEEVRRPAASPRRSVISARGDSHHVRSRFARFAGRGRPGMVSPACESDDRAGGELAVPRPTLGAW